MTYGDLHLAMSRRDFTVDPHALIDQLPVYTASDSATTTIEKTPVKESKAMSSKGKISSNKQSIMPAALVTKKPILLTEPDVTFSITKHSEKTTVNAYEKPYEPATAIRTGRYHEAGDELHPAYYEGMIHAWSSIADLFSVDHYEAAEAGVAIAPEGLLFKHRQLQKYPAKAVIFGHYFTEDLQDNHGAWTNYFTLIYVFAYSAAYCLVNSKLSKLSRGTMIRIDHGTSTILNMHGFVIVGHVGDKGDRAKSIARSIRSKDGTWYYDTRAKEEQFGPIIESCTGYDLMKPNYF